MKTKAKQIDLFTIRHSIHTSLKYIVCFVSIALFLFFSILVNLYKIGKVDEKLEKEKTKIQNLTNYITEDVMFIKAEYISDGYTQYYTVQVSTIDENIKIFRVCGKKATNAIKINLLDNVSAGEEIQIAYYDQKFQYNGIPIISIINSDMEYLNSTDGISSLEDYMWLTVKYDTKAITMFSVFHIFVVFMILPLIFILLVFLVVYVILYRKKKKEVFCNG